MSPRATALTSVSLIGGTVGHSESGNGSYDSFATGDCPSAGTGVSCYTVAVAGARCEFVASNFQLHSSELG